MKNIFNQNSQNLLLVLAAVLSVFLYAAEYTARDYSAGESGVLVAR